MSLFDDREPGEADELFAEAPDGRWQCMLGAQGEIETIFLFGEKGSRFPFGLEVGMSQTQVVQLVGELPAISKPAQVVPMLGWKGSFARWNRPSHCMHAEFGRDGGLHQLTFMVPSRAP